MLIGAGINTILNICLVKLIGPLGASIATAIGYAVVWMVRVKRHKEVCGNSFAITERYYGIWNISDTSCAYVNGSRHNRDIWDSGDMFIDNSYFISRRNRSLLYVK